jgi:hypothetical protein
MPFLVCESAISALKRCSQLVGARSGRLVRLRLAGRGPAASLELEVLHVLASGLELFLVLFMIFRALCTARPLIPLICL